MTGRKIFALTAALFVLCAAESSAFLEGTPEQINSNLQNTIASAKQGNSSAHSKLMEELELYGKLDLTDHTKTEILGYLHRLAGAGMFPAYVFERGSYSYTAGSTYLYASGRNVPVYALPVMQNSGIVSRLNTNGTDYLVYLGVWRDRNGPSWVFVQDRNTGARGWIAGDKARIVPNNTFRQFITDIQRGLQEYNLSALRSAQKNAEIVHEGSSGYDSFVQDIFKKIDENIRSAKAGNISAKKNLERMLRMWEEISSRTNLAKKSWEENDSYTQQLVRDKKVFGSLLGNGYKYDERGILLYAPSSAVIRERPDNEADITARTRANTALRYLGERTASNGEKWFLAEDGGDAGWISERTARVLNIDAVRSFTVRIREGLEEKEDARQDSGGKQKAYSAIALSAIVISLMITLLGLAKYILGKNIR